MKQNENKLTADLSLTIKALVNGINDGKNKINNKELIELCRTSPISLFEANAPHLLQELAEKALNSVLKTHYARDIN